jgi:hypothetical protein
MAATPRVLVISGNMSGVDDETFGSNDFLNEPYHDRIVLTQLDVPQNSVPFSKGWGGECRLEVTITARLQSNGSILVIVNGKLFEGDSESTTDLDDEKTQTVFVPRGNLPIPFNMQLINGGAGDTGTISLTFTNSPWEA